ncbi:hypothetical protein SLEP1_g54275, partial [Rubroshorea leprosula]
REFPCRISSSLPSAFLPLLGSVLLAKFWFPIVLLVSIEIESSVYASEVSKLW